MNKQSNTQSILFVLTLVGLGLCLVNISHLITAVQKKPQASKHIEKNIKLKALEKVDKALEKKIHSPFFVFEANFDPPFRKLTGSSIRPRNVNRKNPVVKKQLFLKGTLIKDNALAVIEDEDGKTYIRKEGDVIHNQVIVSIMPDQVKIRVGKKIEVLTIKEK